VPQWPSLRHCTQLAPLQYRPLPAQLVHAPPQWASVLQARQVPELHQKPEPQSGSVEHCRQVEPEQP